ncbi:MAG: DMT family transporter [Almyronema sp.]
MFLSPIFSLRRLLYPNLLEANPIAISPMAFELERGKLQAAWHGLRQRLRFYLAGISLAIALASIACASIFVVMAAETMSPSAIACNRLLIAGTIFGLWQQWATSQTAPAQRCELVGQQAFTRWQIGGLFLAAGTSFAASLNCAAWSLTQTTVANSTLLNNLMPLFTTLGAWLLLKQAFSRQFLLGLGVALAGVIAIGAQDLQIAADQLTGDAAALLAAIFLAVTLLSIEQLRIQYTTSAVMTGLSAIGAVLLLPLALLSPGGLLPGDMTSGLAVLALAGVSQVLGHGLLTYSLKSLSSGLVSVLMLTIPVMSASLAALLFDQHLGWINSLAFLVVLGGIYLAASSQPPTQDIHSPAAADCPQP